MKLVLEAKGRPVDAWLRDYVRTTVVFAIWRHDLPFEILHVELDGAEDEKGMAYSRCGIRAELRDQAAVTTGATGTDVCSAVQEASDLLEAALHGPPGGAMEAPPERLAA